MKGKSKKSTYSTTFGIDPYYKISGICLFCPASPQKTANF